MKKILLFILLIPTISYGYCFDCHKRDMININEEVIQTAGKYLYVREKTNNNDAPEINRWLKQTGAVKGDPYCQAFFSSMYKESFEQFNLKSPFPMNASVAKTAEYCNKRPLTFKMISTKKITWGINKAETGDLASWKHGSSIYNGFGYKGHAGLVKYSDDNKNIYTIEGNTKAGPGGDQSGAVKGDMKFGNEGVYERVRTMDLNSKFPIMYFIRLHKVQYEIQ